MKTLNAGILFRQNPCNFFMVTVSESAIAFERLLDIEYEFHLGHRRKIHYLRLSFTEAEFMHLAGLHKLEDIKQLKRMPRASVFQGILENPEKMESLLRKSRYYRDLQSRLVPLRHLEQILDSDNLVFRYNQNPNNFSKIRADYLISANVNASEAFLFLVNNLEATNCCSIFMKEGRDYKEQQTKFTVLLKRKIRNVDGKKLTLTEYKRAGYQI